jgi:hypothetical protein
LARAWVGRPEEQSEAEPTAVESGEQPKGELPETQTAQVEPTGALSAEQRLDEPSEV